MYMNSTQLINILYCQFKVNTFVFHIEDMEWHNILIEDLTYLMGKMHYEENYMNKTYFNWAGSTADDCSVSLSSKRCVKYCTSCEHIMLSWRGFSGYIIPCAQYKNKYLRLIEYYLMFI